MDFAKRLVWYLLGVGIGVIFVIGIFGQRDDISCSYFPDSRVKRDILKKEFNFNEEALTKLELMELDSTKLKSIIELGDVIFKKSNTDLDSCKTYYIEDKIYFTIVENCDSIVNLIEINRR